MKNVLQKVVNKSLIFLIVCSVIMACGRKGPPLPPVDENLGKHGLNITLPPWQDHYQKNIISI